MLVLVVLGMLVLAGVAALVVDLGYAYSAQRDLQSSADAAALAGAQGLPDISAAVSYAQEYGSGGKNAHSGVGGVSESVSTTCVDGADGCPQDAVVVTEVAHPPSLFARLLGFHAFTVSVKAAACLEAATGRALLIGATYNGPGCAIAGTSNPDGVGSNPNGGGGPPAPPATTTTTPATTTTTPATTTTTPTTTTVPSLGQPTLSTKLSANPIVAGQSVYDTAALTGATSDAGGTVTYTVFSNSACTLNPVTAGTKAVSHGLVTNSNSVTFSLAGTFYWQASYSGDARNQPALSPCTSEPLTAYSTCALGYPDSSHAPLSSTAFSESTTLAAFAPASAGPGDTIKAWYTDEHALTLGIRQVAVKTKTGTATTTFPISALSSNPGIAISPAVGATIAQGGIDISARPMFPALFITDITGNPTSRVGDWQQGSSAGIPPNAVFGTWKGAVMTTDKTKTPNTVTVTPDADPTKNNWNLGAGSDAPPSGTGSLGYGAEARWNVNNLGLQPGHAYRMEFMVHDGDQNKTGGDAGEGCMTVVIPG